MIIAVDFDGTLVEHKYPQIGETIPDVLEFVKQIKASGNKFILFTCRNGKELEKAIRWCIENGIPPDAVNDDVEEIKNSNFGRSKSCKPFADVYLDDRAVSLSALKYLLVMVGNTKKDGEV